MDGDDAGKELVQQKPPVIGEILSKEETTQDETRRAILALLEVLKKLEQGEFIPYSKIWAIIKEDPQEDKGRAITYQSSLRAIPFNIVMGSVTGEGMKRLDDSTICNTVATSAIQKIHRTAALNGRRCKAVEHYGQLTKEDKVLHQASISMLGALEQAASLANMKLVESRVKSTSETISVSATMRLFSKAPPPEND